MRTFVIACLVLTTIAFGSAATLLMFVQELAATAFAEPSARV